MRADPQVAAADAQHHAGLQAAAAEIDRIPAGKVECQDAGPVRGLAAALDRRADRFQTRSRRSRSLPARGRPAADVSAPSPRLASSRRLAPRRQVSHHVPRSALVPRGVGPQAQFDAAEVVRVDHAVPTDAQRPQQGQMLAANEKQPRAFRTQQPLVPVGRQKVDPQAAERGWERPRVPGWRPGTPALRRS